MESFSYNFSLLSDTFAHGAYQTQNFNRPELRAPSVKGMIRCWHKALGYSESDAQRLFGGINPTQAALVSVRVLSTNEPVAQTVDFMPHKGRAGGAKSAIRPGCGYTLVLAPRRGGIDDALSNQLQNAAKAWLLLGSIGQRSNRAAGSIHWDRCPESSKGFEVEAGVLLERSKVRFAILSGNFGADSVSARNMAGRFPNTRDINVPGYVFGSARPRKPSPLKLKIVNLDGAIKLLAIWIPENAREDTAANLSAGLDLMDSIQGKRELAGMIREVLPRLTA
jgi:hypothetical protein